MFPAVKVQMSSTCCHVLTCLDIFLMSHVLMWMSRVLSLGMIGCFMLFAEYWSQCGNFGNVPNKECDEHSPRCVDIRSDVLREHVQKKKCWMSAPQLMVVAGVMLTCVIGLQMIWDLCNSSCFLLLCSLLWGHPHGGSEPGFWERNMFIFSLLDLTDHCCHDIRRGFTCPFFEKMQRHGDDRSGS